MSPVDIDLCSNIKEISRALDDLAYKQLPFASANAITAIARRIQDAETKALTTVFDRPTPYTMKAFGVIPANKQSLTATVFARDVQAKYLAPSEFNEPQFLGAGKAIRVPIKIGTNAYGNIPKGKIAAMMARPDVFIGTVNGVGGIWQRPPALGVKKGDFAKRVSGKLTLLVKFTNPKSVKTHLEYHARGQEIADEFFNQEFSVAMNKALETAK